MARTLKIVSGGQTGADRAALDFAIAHRINHGGWCPSGRRAEDGTISDEYRLQETVERDYAVRTERNVIDSDGTVIFSDSATINGGTALTLRFAKRHNKPWLHLCRDATIRHAAALLDEFLWDKRVQTLNVAGPRASQDPEIAAFVDAVLTTWWTRLRRPAGA